MDELHVTFTHSKPMNWFLPRIPPTHKKIAVDFVVVVQFRGDKLDHTGVCRRENDDMMTNDMPGGEKLSCSKNEMRKEGDRIVSESV